MVILKGKDSLIVNSLYNLNIQEHIVYVNETLKLYLWHSSPPSLIIGEMHKAVMYKLSIE